MTGVSALALPFKMISKERVIMGITRSEVVRIIIKEGKTYKEQLANTALFVLYRDRMDNLLKGIEIEFLPDQFQHLTGLAMVEINKETGERIVKDHSALEFYHRCTSMPYITEEEIQIRNPGIIDLKMMALPYLTQITKITKMAGPYDQTIKKDLAADYIVGGKQCCIGISKYPDKDSFFPRSCLKEDITKITSYTSQVLAIFQTELPLGKSLYKKIRYVAKGLNLNYLMFPECIKEKISLENYVEPHRKKDSSNGPTSVPTSDC